MKKTEEQKLAKKVIRLVRIGFDRWEDEYGSVTVVVKDCGLNDPIPEFMDRAPQTASFQIDPQWIKDWLKVLLFIGFNVFMWRLITM